MPPSPHIKSLKVITGFLVIATGIFARWAYEFETAWAEWMAIFLVAALPIILTAMWFKYLTPGKWLLARVSIWHIRVFYLSALFILVAFSNKWAGDYINNLMGVDPSHFGITLTTLTVLFIPVNLLYGYGAFIGPQAAFISIDVGVYVGVFLITIYEALSNKKPILIKYLTLTIVVLGAATIFVTANSLIDQRFESMALKFIVWADFNEKHRCIDDWLNESDGVVFLGESKVLAHFNYRNFKNEFVAGSCTHEKS